MTRFFLEPENIRDGRFFLQGEDAAHALKVLRLRENDVLVVLDGKGGSFQGRIEQVGKNQLSGALIGPVPSAGDLPVTLSCALLKGEKFDWVIQKCTELGVKRIQPLITKRCVAQGEKIVRWRKIAREAAEQSERMSVPEILSPLPLAALTFEGLALFCSERGGEKLPNVLEKKITLDHFEKTDITAIVGPEGGFTPAEAELLLSKGATPVSLGERILRAETAAVTVTSMLLYRFLAESPPV